MQAGRAYEMLIRPEIDGSHPSPIAMDEKKIQQIVFTIFFQTFFMHTQNLKKLCRFIKMNRF